MAQKARTEWSVPNFFIVGAAKAGTTSLYRYLRQHPQVFMPGPIKETFFFAGLSPDQFPGPGRSYGSVAVTSWEAYRQCFAGSASYPARGEACVAYLYYADEAIPRMKDRLGSDVRIIMSLRDPAERAYSNYLHHVRDGIEPLSFAESIEASDQRRAAGWWWGFQYVEVGCYYRQVKAYLDAFGPDRVLVLLHDDLAADTPGSLARIFRFLAIDDTFLPDVSVRYNATGQPRLGWVHRGIMNGGVVRELGKRLLPVRLRERLMHQYFQHGLARAPLSAAMRARLVARFRDDVLNLQDLIQRDLSNWLKG